MVQADAMSYENNRAGEVTEKAGPEGTAEYQWNGRGELVRAELSDGSTVSYGYDAFGRLVSRVKTPADGEVPPTAERSEYIWNRRKILAEYNESRGGGLELYKQYFRAAGRLVAVKMYGFHGRREPGPEGFLHTKGGLMYYHVDRLGSPVSITDRHGEPIARYAWDAYGRAMAGVFGSYNTVGFTGKQQDGATGLTYFGARWYDADSGRFMSRDPIKDGWNAYVGGDPVNYVDEWGLMASEAGKYKNASSKTSIEVLGSFSSVAGVAINSSELVRNKVSKLNTSRTLRNSAGALMRQTGELARKVKVRNLARTSGNVLTTAGIATSTTSAFIDTTKMVTGDMGTVEYAVRTSGNLLSAYPSPITVGAGLTITVGAEFVFGDE